MTSPSPLARRPPDAIPLTLLTGFLGAGKTTLLNRLVRSPSLARSVVVINEVGEIPIDHLLVEVAEGDLLTLSSGCICCTVRGELVSLLEDLLRRRDNARMAAFDRVLIETTGLADPGPILNSIALHPYLAMRFRVDGVVTVVDALHGLETLAEHHEAADQVAFADVIVLAKADLLPATEALRGRLAALNPAAPLLDAAAGEADASAMMAASQRAAADRGGGTGHHHHHRHDGVGTIAMRTAASLEPAAVAAFLDLIRAGQGTGLLRAKGLLSLADDPGRPLVVQIVRDTVHPPRRLAVWPDADRDSRLVAIGRDLDETALRRVWDAFLGGPAVDRPDAAGLTAFRQAGPGLF